MTDQPRSAMLADLQRSGISTTDIKKLGISLLTENKTEGLTGFKETAGYKIPYYSSGGRKTGFYRIRFSNPPKDSNRPGKFIRYWQPQKSAPQLYYSPYIKWASVFTSQETTLFFTEGEKKAARACKEGIPCIGLGGVWSWRAAKQGITLLEDFQHMTLKGRKVVIVFDSDVHENVHVQQAMSQFARELIRLGASVFTIKLPSREKEKIGLDDYLEKESLQAFHELPLESLLGGLGQELWTLNEELAYIEESEAVLRFNTGQLITPQSLVSLAYANRRITVLGARGPIQVSVAAEWVKWPFRRTHRRVTYRPGVGQITDDNEINLWPGWGCEPKKGDITLWAQLLEYMFKSAPEQKRWFLQWLACPIQRPGTKLFSAVVFYSLAEGVGKSLVGVTMGKIYGKNYSYISQEELQGTFNEWLVGKQFILGDDVTGGDRRRDADRLKIMISREVVQVNRKYQPQYAVPDYANYLFTTNQPDAFFLAGKDRRYFIHEIVGDPLPDKFYKEYDHWLKKGPGPSAIFHHLLNNIDLAGFNPAAHAPMTEAKAEMTELSRSDLDSWAVHLAQNPEDLIQMDNQKIKRELLTTQELVHFYDPLNERKTTLIAMAKALRRAGFKPLSLTSTKMGMKRLWAVVNKEKWAKALHHERADHYMDERKQLEPKRKF